MPTKPTLTAVTPLGTFTRTTNNKYQFVVVTDGYKSPESIKAYYADALKREKATLAEYRAVVASGISPSRYSTIEDYKRYIAGCEELIAARPADAAAALADNEAKKGVWGAYSWSSKRQLADREAAKARSMYVNVHVFPVEG